jgi:hypothetical protein
MGCRLRRSRCWQGIIRRLLLKLVYRHQIVPALTRGAEVMDQIFG